MKKWTTDDQEAKSTDLISENINHLKEIFPEVFTEGKVDFEVLRQILGDDIDDQEEKYGLNWHGKRQARQIALTQSTGTLRPCPDDSVDWDKTNNLMIEGDNLEVLKILQKSYSGKVKLIYIDPPYNTGKDFVYPDKFQNNIQNYLEITSQLDGSGNRVSTNPETSGRFHTDWLNMIYPRLKIARNLLRDDGVIFVTIDDVETSNLRLVMDEIFGSENLAATICWKKRSSPDARDTIGSIHDWILCYVKNGDKIKSSIGKMPLSEDRRKAYTNPDNDPRGDWASVDMTGMTGRATKDQYFSVTLPSGRIIGPPEGRSWGLAEKTFLDLREDNRIWFGLNGDNVPRIKKFLSESEGQVVPSFWDMVDVGSNDEAKKEINSLMREPDVFDTPKPVRLVNRMIQTATKSDENSIIMDFFAGSGTSGHSTLYMNNLDQGNRRYIIVQLPQELDPERRDQKTAANFCDKIGKPRNIAELTKERLRRASKKILEENPMFSGDLGFRVFKLDSTNIQEWEPKLENLEKALQTSIDHLKTDRTETDILYELLLKLGLDLCVPMETQTISGKNVHSVGGGVLMACLATKITRDDVEPLAQGIVNWHKKLSPAGETTCVFRDSAFVDDVAKTNLAAILNQHGIENVRSL
jgi:adenine-specific DNA-methyltransferase